MGIIKFMDLGKDGPFSVTVMEYFIKDKGRYYYIISDFYNI